MTTEQTKTILRYLDEEKQRLAFQDQKRFTISGYTIRYNELNNLNNIFLPGCADEWLATPKKRPLWFDHNEDLVVGEVTVFRHMPKGLWVEGVVNDTALGKDMQTLIKAGVIENLSACYLYSRAHNPEPPPGEPDMVRKVLDIEEVTLAVVSAGPGTVLASAGKETREKTYTECRERIEKYWDVWLQIKTDAVHNIILNAIQDCTVLIEKNKNIV